MTYCPFIKETCKGELCEFYKAVSEYEKKIGFEGHCIFWDAAHSLSILTETATDSWSIGDIVEQLEGIKDELKGGITTYEQNL